MNIFNKIKSWFALSEQNKETDKTPIAETGLHLTDNTINAIVGALQQLSFVGKDIVGLKIFVLPKSQTDELAYNNLLPTEEFKTELQRKLDNKWVKLSDNWTFSFEIVTNLPEESSKINEVLAIQLLNRRSIKHKEATIIALAGKTWKKNYDLKPNEVVYNIGRGKKPVLESGRIQENQIAFIDPDEQALDEKTNDINLHISRFHGSIQYDLVQMKYCLHLAKMIFQSGHDTKILRSINGKENKIDINNEQISYPLEDGDQIVFNKKAILEFRLKA